MVDSLAAKTIPNLSNLGNVVPEGYTYYEKIVKPGEGLSLPTAYLKWYDLYPEDAPITPKQDAETRAFLAEQVKKLNFEGDLGFVILHRAGKYLLLLLTTWRNTNEMWESVYFKEADSADGYVTVPHEGINKGTYCVWELGAVWHERHAWVRFLSSKRDDAAKLDYLNSHFSGRV
ncbi:MAG: hypothetical protein ABI690_24175 [Chloroflexota bacterium]